MYSPQPVEARTRLFARVLGPYLLIVAAAALGHASEMRALLADFGSNPTLSWTSGAFVLLGGLVVIALHSSWRNPAAAAVSLLGWSTAAKGVFLMAFPGRWLAFAGLAVEGNAWRVACAVLGLVGLWLSSVGWAPRRADRSRRAASAPGEKPSAAGTAV